MPQNIEEIALQTVALYADRIELVLLVEFVFLCGCLQNLAVRITHHAVGVHQLIDHFLRNHRVFGNFLHDNVAHTAYGLPANAHIYMGNIGPQSSLELRDDIGKTLHGLVNVIHNALANALCGVFSDYS